MRQHSGCPLAEHRTPRSERCQDPGSQHQTGSEAPPSWRGSQLMVPSFPTVASRRGSLHSTGAWTKHPGTTKAFSAPAVCCHDLPALASQRAKPCLAWMGSKTNEHGPHPKWRLSSSHWSLLNCKYDARKKNSKHLETKNGKKPTHCHLGSWVPPSTAPRSWCPMCSSGWTHPGLSLRGSTVLPCPGSSQQKLATPRPRDQFGASNWRRIHSRAFPSRMPSPQRWPNATPAKKNTWNVAGSAKNVCSRLHLIQKKMKYGEA